MPINSFEDFIDVVKGGVIPDAQGRPLDLSLFVNHIVKEDAKKFGYDVDNKPELISEYFNKHGSYAYLYSQILTLLKSLGRISSSAEGSIRAGLRDMAVMEHNNKYSFHIDNVDDFYKITNVLKPMFHNTALTGGMFRFFGKIANSIYKVMGKTVVQMDDILDVTSPHNQLFKFYQWYQNEYIKKSVMEHLVDGVRDLVLSPENWVLVTAPATKAITNLWGLRSIGTAVKGIATTAIPGTNKLIPYVSNFLSKGLIGHASRGAVYGAYTGLLQWAVENTAEQAGKWILREEPARIVREDSRYAEMLDYATGGFIAGAGFGLVGGVLKTSIDELVSIMRRSARSTQAVFSREIPTFTFPKALPQPTRALPHPAWRTIPEVSPPPAPPPVIAVPPTPPPVIAVPPTPVAPELAAEGDILKILRNIYADIAPPQVIEQRAKTLFDEIKEMYPKGISITTNTIDTMETINRQIQQGFADTVIPEKAVDDLIVESYYKLWNIPPTEVLAQEVPKKAVPNSIVSKVFLSDPKALSEASKMAVLQGLEKSLTLPQLPADLENILRDIHKAVSESSIDLWDPMRSKAIYTAVNDISKLVQSIVQPRKTTTIAGVIGQEMEQFNKAVNLYKQVENFKALLGITKTIEKKVPDVPVVSDSANKVIKETNISPVPAVKETIKSGSVFALSSNGDVYTPVTPSGELLQKYNEKSSIKYYLLRDKDGNVHQVITKMEVVNTPDELKGRNELMLQIPEVDKSVKGYILDEFPQNVDIDEFFVYMNEISKELKNVFHPYTLMHLVKNHNLTLSEARKIVDFLVDLALGRLPKLSAEEVKNRILEVTQILEGKGIMKAKKFYDIVKDIRNKNDLSLLYNIQSHFLKGKKYQRTRELLSLSSELRYNPETYSGVQSIKMKSATTSIEEAAKEGLLGFGAIAPLYEFSDEDDGEMLEEPANYDKARHNVIELINKHPDAVFKREPKDLFDVIKSVDWYKTSDIFGYMSGMRLAELVK